MGSVNVMMERKRLMELARLVDSRVLFVIRINVLIALLGLLLLELDAVAWLDLQRFQMHASLAPIAVNNALVLRVVSIVLMGSFYWMGFANNALLDVLAARLLGARLARQDIT
jgi:hypothetical protein